MDGGDCDGSRRSTSPPGAHTSGARGIFISVSRGGTDALDAAAASDEEPSGPLGARLGTIFPALRLLEEAGLWTGPAPECKLPDGVLERGGNFVPKLPTRQIGHLPSRVQVALVFAEVDVQQHRFVAVIQVA